MDTTRHMTRRGFLAAGAAATVGAGLALGGCTGDAGSGSAGSAETDESTSTEGLATDTVQRSYPVTLTIYADSNLQWHLSNRGGGQTMLDYLASAYQDNVKDDVDFEFEYYDPAELLEMAEDGFPEGDAVVALTSTIEAGSSAETLEGGEGGYMIRSLAYHLSEQIVLVRADGTDDMLPEAPTIDGEDSSDGTINRMQQLADYDGVVAIADPEACTEGVLADKALAKQGFYSDYDGVSGYYDESIADKLRMYPDQDSAMLAVQAGVCQLGFALDAALSSRYPGVEECYEPPGGSASYSGCALIDAAEPGVARDFFEFLANHFSG